MGEIEKDINWFGIVGCRLNATAEWRDIISTGIIWKVTLPELLDTLMIYSIPVWDAGYFSFSTVIRRRSLDSLPISIGFLECFINSVVLECFIKSVVQVPIGDTCLKYLSKINISRVLVGVYFASVCINTYGKAVELDMYHVTWQYSFFSETWKPAQIISCIDNAIWSFSHFTCCNLQELVKVYLCNVLLFCRHTFTHFLALACTKTQLRASATNLLWTFVCKDLY